MSLTTVPTTLPKANSIIQRWHRHHGPLPGGFAWWAVAAVAEDGRVVGVALAGRPTNRNNDDGQTVEVQRVATDGHRNACSILYGACARAAQALGARRIITYTLDEESGSSLRAVGWVREADGIESWWTHAGSRTPAVDREHMRLTKVRWAKHFRPAVVVDSELGGAASPAGLLGGISAIEDREHRPSSETQGTQLAIPSMLTESAP